MTAAERQARRQDRIDAMEAQLAWLARWVDLTLDDIDRAEERIFRESGRRTDLHFVRQRVLEMKTRLKPSHLDLMREDRTRWRREKGERVYSVGMPRWKP